MKNIIFPTAFILLFGQGLFATPTIDKNELKLKKLRTELSRNIKVPASLKKEGLHEKVSVVFNVNHEKLNVIEVRTENKELKKHVEQHLKNVQLSSEEKLDGTYNVDFDFKVL